MCIYLTFEVATGNFVIASIFKFVENLTLGTTKYVIKKIQL